MTLRPYGIRVGDFQMVSEWWKARHGVPFPENMVPPLGVVCEEYGQARAAIWAYQSVGIGLAFAEYAITRPGMSFGESRRFLGHAFTGLLAVLKKDGYSVIRCFCQPAMARALKSFGFHGEKGNLIKTF